MIVACSRCGRKSTVAEPRPPPACRSCGAPVEPDRRSADGGEPRFIVDAMLGRLARYLRLLGYDTVYDADLDDAGLVELGRAEARVVVTRDVRLVRELRPPAFVLVKSDQPLEQLGELDRGLPLSRRSPSLARCSICNTRVAPAPEDRVRDRVPPRVRERQTEFVCCPRCGRVYWEGSHVHRLRERLRRVL